MEGSSRRRPRPARRRSRSLRGRRGTDRRVLEQSGARDRPRRVRLHHERQTHVEIGRAHVELQSRLHLVCRLLLEKKKKTMIRKQSELRKETPETFCLSVAL